MTRIFCDIVKDFAENKRWKREHHKMIVENFAFLLLLDKKLISDMSLDQKNSENVFYHYTDSFDSRINHSKIWFIEALNISKKRFQKVQKTAKAHLQWKIQSHKEYEDACRIYLKDRIAWEYHLIQQVLDILDLEWSTEYFKEKILRVAHSIKMIFLENIQKIVEKNDFF
jgi:hypothetical protein